ncbi:MAG: hypothetical protein AAGF83_14690 [Cyanobacteria bacterium P01_G01_bin.67]
MKTLIKSNIKEFIASNKVVSKLYYALFKEQVSIKVIDEFCKATKVVPTHIKIDIEGAEMHAVKEWLKP